MINEGIDTGDILQQAQIDMAEDETALSLNLKCYDAALKVFPELVDSLADNSYQRTPQDLNLRSYCAFNKKPPNNGWIDWRQSAEEIERLFRATQLGNYINRFSCIKFTLQFPHHSFVILASHMSSLQEAETQMAGSQSFTPQLASIDHQSYDAFIITKLARLPEKSNEPPGTLLSCTDDYWRVATLTQDIAIYEVCTLDGQVQNLNSLKKMHQLKTGINISTCQDTNALNEFTEINESCLQHEKYWVEQWQHFEAVKIPFLTPKKETSLKQNYQCAQQWLIPLHLKNLWTRRYSSYDLSTLCLSLWIIYLIVWEIIHQ